MIFNQSQFIWGTSTAAYQIEGAYNQEGKGPSIWDHYFNATPEGKSLESGNVACNHYQKYKEDISYLKDKIPNYRFSIAWSRVLPNGIGEVNAKGIDFYDRLIDELLAAGVTPWVTTYHWDLPQALQEKGGWTNRDINSWFEEYHEILCKRFGDRVKNWMVLNEPSVHSYMGYALKVHAPAMASESAYFKAVHNMNRVIRNGYQNLKSHSSVFSVGSSYTLMPIRAASENEKDKRAASVYQSVWNENFYAPLFTGEYPENLRPYFEKYIPSSAVDQVKTQLDFVGIQYYSPLYIKHDPNAFLNGDFGKPPEHLDKSDIGWPIEPDGFKEALKWLDKRYCPEKIIVTENGIALNDKPNKDGQVDDQKRIRYLEKHIQALHEAIEDGVPVQGYFIWSLLDNLEWDEGYDMRFGLIHVDYESEEKKRTPKQSYDWYTNLINQYNKGVS